MDLDFPIPKMTTFNINKFIILFYDASGIPINHDKFGQFIFATNQTKLFGKPYKFRLAETINNDSPLKSVKNQD